jgi:hypothetical protein
LKCGLCEWEQPDAEGGIEAGVDYIRVMHPEHYGDGPERWPDGGIVLHDETIEPDDFAAEDK